MNVIEFEVTTALKKLLKLSKDSCRFKVVKGGTGGGKTFNILPILLDKAIKTEGLEISVVAETIPHLKRGALKDFKKIARDLGRWNPSFWNSTDKIYRLPNGSSIEFFSAEDGDKLRGARRDILYINECNRISLESFNQLNIRTNLEVWLDYNPVSSFWINTEVIPRDNAKLITLTYKDNEALPQTVVDEILNAKKRAEEGSSYWSNWFNVYGLGLEGALEGAVITEYKTIKELPRDEEGELETRLIGLGVDFGYTNDVTAIVGLWKYNDSFIIDEVCYKSGLMNFQIAQVIKDYAKEIDYEIEEIEVYVDNAEPKSRDELIHYGVPNTYSCKNKQIVQGVNLINQQKNLILESAENVLREVGVYVWEKDKEGNATNKPKDKDNHSIDSWRYILTSHLGNPSGEYYVY